MMKTPQETLISISSTICQDNLSLLHLALHPRTDHVVKPQLEQNQQWIAAMFSNEGRLRTCTSVPRT